MANLHILERTGDDFRVVVHVSVPGGNNSAGLAWVTAVLRSGRGGTTILPSGDGTGGTIAAAELTSIQAGSLVEVVTTLRILSAGQSGAQINAYLDGEFTRITTETQGALQAALAQYGRVR